VCNLITNDAATRRLFQGRNVVGLLIERLSDDVDEVVVEASGALRSVSPGDHALEAEDCFAGTLPLMVDMSCVGRCSIKVLCLTCPFSSQRLALQDLYTGEETNILRYQQPSILSSRPQRHPFRTLRFNLENTFSPSLRTFCP
jgi:hypothetical protein